MILFYVANVRLPTEKAHGIQIVKMCESFVKLGINVILIAPIRSKTKKMNNFYNDVYDYYNVKKNFEIKKLFNLDFLFLDKYLPRYLNVLPFILQNSSFLIRTLFYCLFKKVDIIFTRSFFFAVLIVFFKKNKIILELHNLPFQKLSRFIFKKLIGRIKRIIVINENIKTTLISWGVKKELIFTSTSAVSDDFLKKFSKIEARKALDMELNKKIIMYTGNLYPWKGVYTIAEAALTRQDYLFYIVGGSEVDKDVQAFKAYLKNKNIKNVKLRGYVNPSLIPQYLAAADILVAPNSAKSDASANYTSPLKLYEYMASRRPIILSDLKSMRTLINKNLVFWMIPDDPKSLIRAINEVEKNELDAKKKVDLAFSFVKTKTWDFRAKEILKFCNLI